MNIYHPAATAISLMMTEVNGERSTETDRSMVSLLFEQ